MQEFIKNQQCNLFIYTPFLMAGGAALYFSLSREPHLIFAPIITAVLLASVFIKQVPILLRGLLLFLFGFYYAAVFTDFKNTPDLKHNIHNMEIVGRVDAIDYTPDKVRIYLTAPIKGVEMRIRVSANDTAMVRVGDTVRTTVGLFQPASAYAPGTFDYARWAYFNNLSATGYATELSVVESGTGGINAMRDFLHRQTESFLVDSLILGYKNAVPKSDNKIWTATGVGHIWSISGFHMALVGGWLFAMFYFIFRRIPYIVRRIPAKIPAMIVAWVGLVGYLFLSGADVATVRAFLMTTLVFTAFIFGRNAISVRNFALAFCIILLINPHYVMQAGFQLSFAAVFGLVWLYSEVQPKMPKNKILKIIYGMVLTSVVATVFTAPFVAAHFGAIPIYSLIGNLILLPIFSVVIMPLVIVGAVGINIAVDAAHAVYNFTFEIAEWIAALPAANATVPYIPNTAMICFVLGLMFLILVRGRFINYMLCVLFILLGVIHVYNTPRPIFYATYDNELIAARGADGKLYFNKSRASNHYFAFDTWKQINGEGTETSNPRLKHENGIYRFGNIVYMQKFVPTMKNIKSLCDDDSVRYIVSYFEINSPSCAHKIIRGGFVIYPDDRVKYISHTRRWN